MRRFQKTLTAILLMGAFAVTASCDKKNGALNNRSQSELEQRRAEIDTELEQLADPSIRSGLGTGGAISERHQDPHHTEWIQIALEEETSIDQITLVPAISLRFSEGFVAEGFPEEFKLIVGTEQNTNGTVVASFTAEDHLLPGIAPVNISFPARKASWIRLEANVLTRGSWYDQYVLQLSEMMVFSGPDNVALHRPVQVSSDGKGISLAFSKESLVDGQIPYLMHGAKGESSRSYIRNITDIEEPILSIDLGKRYPIDRIHLHALEISTSIPQTDESATGVPLHMLIEGANQPDFSDAVLLVDFRRTPPYETGPIFMHRFPETSCRYVRLNVREPFRGKRYAWLGFAEIEIFSRNQNLALGKTVEANFATSKTTALTDGRNFYGDILPIRDWLSQLAKRHKLETERPLIVAEMNERYARQKVILQRMFWIAGLLVLVTIIILVRGQTLRQRLLFKTRERIAANLHDELGANLHAIGLLGDMAQGAQSNPKRLSNLLQKIRALTERTGNAARHCANLLESEGLYDDLLTEEIRRTASRILIDLDHSFTFEGEALLKTLPQRRRIDLLLFYTESLTNILRHSGATTVSTRLIAERKEIALTVTDNGQGITSAPASLTRRARLMSAKVSVKKPTNGGTEITLRLRNRNKISKVKST